MYLKASAIVEKMGYKGHVLGSKEKGKKAPISLVSYKYNRGLGFTPVAKITITRVQSDPPTNVEDSDEEEFHEIPFEY